MKPPIQSRAVQRENAVTNSDDYLTPHEAAEQLERLSNELVAYGVDAQDLDELRLIGRRFSHHLYARETLHYLLKDVAEGILC
jgi:hypothetical protein